MTVPLWQWLVLALAYLVVLACWLHLVRVNQRLLRELDRCRAARRYLEAGIRLQSFR